MVTADCPSCGRKLRVPDELLGQLVKCPQCSAMFTAGAGGGPGPAAGPPSGAPADPPSAPRRPTPPADDADEPFDEGEEDFAGRPRSRRALAATKVPAIFLLVTGVLSLLAQAYWMVNLLLVNEAMIEKQLPPARTPEERQGQRIGFDIVAGSVGRAITAVSLGISFLVVIGAVCILLGRLHWLGVLGSVLAMVDVGCLCCLLGLPFGIWNLVVLLREDVRAAFR